MKTNLAKANNKKLKVVQINGGHNILKKLNSMGIFEGSWIEKVVSYEHGPIIVKVMNSRLAIGRGMAEKIMVEEI
ncbi:MAG TPA: FeoA domain-containing protein [Elusimicrobiales bacterium]|nr:FeoA domain-containing protein [Elusimicrobiales bacterium]HOL63457.1 FeoA domain-containing protein [Elusimicrobiales bacterium]HPO95331.1 FeoA domain-containing protein [Elusimicrobiales bacterium]